MVFRPQPSPTRLLRSRDPGPAAGGMIARMNLRAKNHLALLKAAARVVSNFPGVEFVLAGDGPYEAN